MRPLFLALVAPLALTLSTPLSAAADLTTQTDATLSCSDNHSVVMSLDQTALTNLLTDVQAINMSGLMTCDVATAASSQTADWTVYDYNPSGQALAPRHSPNSMPATTTGTTTTFNFKNGIFTALLTTTDPSLDGNLTGKTLNDSISLSGPALSFMSQNGQGCTGPDTAEATARFYFTSPSAAGPSVGTPPAGFYTQFWWSDAAFVPLGTGNEGPVIIGADMSNPAEWSDWNGQPAATQTEAFYEAVQKVQSIGLSFGGECFFENGVTAENNSSNTEQFSSTFTENTTP
jgi:hypothetical protein